MHKNFEYKVIGWTGYADRRFPDYNHSKEAYESLIECVRKNGYYFKDDAPDCVPVFNDCTVARLSLRGWRGVMADAWQSDTANTNNTDIFYKPKTVNYPKKGINFLLVENKTTNKLPLKDKEFTDKRYLCEKSLFINVLSEEHKEIERGNFIDFIDEENGESIMSEAFVINIYSAQSVEEILDMMQKNIPDWKDLSEELGFAPKLKKEQIAKLIRKKISPDDEKKYGVWGTEVFYP